MQESKLIIYGCGGHARSVANVAIANNIKQIIFIDENAKEHEMLFGFEVKKQIDNSAATPSHIAIGDNQIRSHLFSELEAQQKTFSTLIATDAHLGQDAFIDAGCFIGWGVYIGPQTRIGKNTILNTHCVVEHDCQIGNHTHISVNATIAGKCQIGDYVMIGAGATVIDNIKICDNVIIGAGGVVINDITEPGTYVGVPVRRL